MSFARTWPNCSPRFAKTTPSWRLERWTSKPVDAAATPVRYHGTIPVGLPTPQRPRLLRLLLSNRQRDLVVPSANVGRREALPRPPPPPPLPPLLRTPHKHTRYHRPALSLRHDRWHP